MLPSFLSDSETLANADFFQAFVNIYVNKDLTDTYVKGKLEKYRKEAFLQHTARIAFDFQISDADKYTILFDCRNCIKWIWQFIFLSYHDQELLLMEPRYQHVAKDFERVNTFQKQKGVIAKRMLQKCANFSSFSS